MANGRGFRPRVRLTADLTPLDATELQECNNRVVQSIGDNDQSLDGISEPQSRTACGEVDTFITTTLLPQFVGVIGEPVASAANDTVEMIYLIETLAYRLGLQPVGKL